MTRSPTVSSRRIPATAWRRPGRGAGSARTSPPANLFRLASESGGRGTLVLTMSLAAVCRRPSRTSSGMRALRRPWTSTPTFSTMTSMGGGGRAMDALLRREDVAKMLPQPTARASRALQLRLLIARCLEVRPPSSTTTCWRRFGPAGFCFPVSLSHSAAARCRASTLNS